MNKVLDRESNFYDELEEEEEEEAKPRKGADQQERAKPQSIIS